MAMKLKTVTVDGKELAEVRNGKPVYVNDDGTETEGDLPQAIGKIKDLREEMKQSSERATALEKAAEAWKGMDPAKAREHADLVAKLDEKKLLDAGEVDKVTASIHAGYKSQLDELGTKTEAEKAALRTEADDLARGYAFSQSSYVKDKLLGGAHAMQVLFGPRFERVGGALVVKDRNGNPILSKTRHGEPADFDEALAAVVDEYPYKKNILRDPGMNGGGTQPSAGRPGSAVVLSEAEARDPARYRAAKDAAAKSGQPLQIGT
jgi:hypothetical protein